MLTQVSKIYEYNNYPRLRCVIPGNSIAVCIGHPHAFYLYKIIKAEVDNG